jgi:hypothetical protein
MTLAAGFGKSLTCITITHVDGVRCATRMEPGHYLVRYYC